MVYADSPVQVVVLNGVGGALEHVEHALGDGEATADVDGGHQHGRGGQPLRGRRARVRVCVCVQCVWMCVDGRGEGLSGCLNK